MFSFLRQLASGKKSKTNKGDSKGENGISDGPSSSSTSTKANGSSPQTSKTDGDNADHRIRKALYLVSKRCDPKYRSELRDFIDSAPEPVIGREPTKEEKAVLVKFRTKADNFIKDLPPESGIFYNEVMKEVDDEMAKFRKMKKSNSNSNLVEEETLVSPKVFRPRKIEVSTKSSPPTVPLETPTRSSPKKIVRKNSAQMKTTDKKKVKKPKPITLVDYLVLVDFMATCNDGPPPKPQEVIEFPAVLLNIHSGEIESTFHRYVRPDVNPRLSQYCVELTGIEQHQIDKAKTLDGVLEEHRDWLKENNVISLPEALSEGEKSVESKNTFLYTTCGDWDLKVCLQSQFDYHKKPIPVAFLSWINVKWPFENMFHRKAQDISDLISGLGLMPQTNVDSGLDDCRNLALICKKLIQNGWTPTATAGVGRIGTSEFWHVQKRRAWPPQADPVTPYKMVYLIRHGECIADQLDMKDRRVNATLKDCDLTEKGIKDSKDFSAKMTEKHLNAIELVVASPLKRALHSALLAFSQQEIIVNYDLAEIGLDIPENAAKPIEQVMEELGAVMKSRNKESKIDFQTNRPKNWPKVPDHLPASKRVQEAFEWIYLERQEQTIAVVCHLNVIRAAIYGASGPIAPENLTPIRCKLFMNGKLIPI